MSLQYYFLKDAKMLKFIDNINRFKLGMNYVPQYRNFINNNKMKIFTKMNIINFKCNLFI